MRNFWIAFIICFILAFILLGCANKPEPKQTELKGWGHSIFEALKGEFKGQGNVKDCDEKEWNLIPRFKFLNKGNDYEI